MSLKDDDLDDDGNPKDGVYAPDAFVEGQPPAAHFTPEMEARDAFYNTHLSEDNLTRMTRQANETLRLVAAWREFDKKPT